MLRHLNIRNFAIIDHLELELESGMTVLSGETGAGKSILIDALGLLLGDRADSDSVREGSDRADISAEFSLTDANIASEWLTERELLDPDNEDTCLIRRTVSADGRGRATINGSTITVRELKELGELLLDIHGQHAHQSLLKPEIQRELLDGFGKHQAHCKKVNDIYQAYKTAAERLGSLENRDEEGGMRADYLKFQLQELDALNLQTDELTSLDEEHKRLANAGRLLEDGQKASELLYESEEGSIFERLNEALVLIRGLQEVDDTFTDIKESIDTASIQIQEASRSLRDKLEKQTLDPERLEQVETRLGVVNDLARKHQVRTDELIAHHENLRQELAGLENSNEEIERLKNELKILTGSYQKAAVALSEARAESALKLADQVEKIIHELGMPKGCFEIAISSSEAAEPRAHGIDHIEYQVSANPGQSPKPLGKVASGGELSRISLAIQVVGAENTHVPSLIFDEVDSGIGGSVAEIVGKQLSALGATRQTLCVTHLPQVAAQADHHLFVGKIITENSTLTKIQTLNGTARVEEIARMLGGVNITTQTRAHAAEMLGMESDADAD